MHSSLKSIFCRDDFKSAVRDVVYLYDRNYPEKTVIQAVGNRYRLTRQERMILYRGISKLTYNRPLNILKPDLIRDKSLFVDGFNVIITLESYLKGIIVFKGMDDITRDIAGLHSYKSNPDICEKALSLFMLGLIKLKPYHTEVIFDYPVSGSGKMANMVNRCFDSEKIKGRAFTDRSPDYMLKLTDKVVCSSDSAIIKSAQEVFDMPGFIIEGIMNKKIFSIPKN